MKSNTDNSKKKNDEYTSIRVKGNTKSDVNKFFEKINKTEDYGKRRDCNSFCVTA